MKRLICLLILVALFLPGCGSQEEYVQPVNFYYLRSNVTYFASDGVVAKETREAEGHRQDYEYLLNIYLRGPESRELKQVFPKNTKLVQFELTETSAIVTLNDSFARLMGLDLTIACACLTTTVCDMTGAKVVTIRTESRLLDGNKSITMTRDQILLLDSSISQ